jgi:hypothetical protein
MFSLGQAVELYLKAAYAKLRGSVDEAERKGHDIKALWVGCKDLTEDCMPDYEIRDAVWNADLFGAGWQKDRANLSAEDLDHFERNRELYFIPTRRLHTARLPGRPSSATTAQGPAAGELRL